MSNIKDFVIENGILRKYNGDGCDVIIPDGVTVIGGRVFFDCSRLTSVTIPDSVTNICAYAFFNCSGLTSIKIPNGIISIADGAFHGCTGLKSVMIPGSVETIGYKAFADTPALESLSVDANNKIYHSSGNCLIDTKRKRLICGCKTSVIPNDGSVTEIYDSAFLKCSGLEKVIIPETIETIDQYAFYGCSELKSITIPDSIKKIGDSAFGNCTSLKTAGPVGSGYNYEFEWKTSIPAYAFYGCTELKSITIPDGVTSIKKSAFSGCVGLTDITIPNSITSISDGAFYGCAGLTSIKIPDSVETLGAKAFMNCSSVVELKLPNSALTFDMDMIDGISAVFRGCTSLTSVTIPGTIKTIPVEAFRDCSNLREIIIEEGVTTIDAVAFYNCAALESVSLPKSIKGIKSRAFSGCEKLKNAEGYIIIDGWLLDSPQAESLTIPNGVETITENSLHSGTEYICFPDSVKMIEDNPVGFGWGNPVSNIPEGYLQQTVKLPENVTERLLKTDSWKEQATDKDYIALYLFQTGKKIQQFIKEFLEKEPDKKLKLMCDILSKGGKTAYFTKAVDYYISYKDDVSSDTVNTLFNILTASKMKPLAEKLKGYLAPGHDNNNTKETTSENATESEEPVFIYKSMERFDANRLFKDVFNTDDIKKIKLPPDKQYALVIDKHEFTVKTLISKRMKNRFYNPYYKMYDAYTAISTMRSKEEVLKEIDQMDPGRGSDAFMLASPEFRKDLPQLSDGQIEMRKKFIVSIAYLISNETVIDKIVQLVPKKKNGTFMKGRTIRIAGSGMAIGNNKVLDIYGKTTSDLILEIYFDERYVNPDDLVLMSEDYVCTHIKSLGLSKYMNAE